MAFTQTSCEVVRDGRVRALCRHTEQVTNCRSKAMTLELRVLKTFAGGILGFWVSAVVLELFYFLFFSRVWL